MLSYRFYTSLPLAVLIFCLTLQLNDYLDGTQYRLVSPYESNHMALNYVSGDRNKAVLFAYDLHPPLGKSCAL